MKWIKIYHTENEIDANMIKGLLESHEVQVNLVPNRATSVIKGPELYVMANLPFDVFVPEQQKEQAIKILDIDKEN